MTTHVTLTPDQADYVIATVAPVAKARISGWAKKNQRVFVDLPPAAIDHLKALDADIDGHVDTDDNLWIGGYMYPLATTSDD